MLRVAHSVWATAVVTACLMNLLAPAEATACTPPPMGWEFSVEEPIEDLPLDGAVIFHGTIVSSVHSDPDLAGGSLEFTVTGPEDSVVDGSPRFKLVRQTTSLDFHESDAIRTYLIAWIPNTPLEPETEYQLEVRQDAESEEWWGDSGVVDTLFTTGTEPTAQLSAPGVEDSWFSVSTHTVERKCCTIDPQNCVECFPEGDCEHCWTTRLVDKPSVAVELSAPAQVPTQQVIYHVKDDADVVQRELMASQTTTVSVTYPVDHEEPYCLRVVAEDLATGETADSEMICVDAETYDLGEREPDGYDADHWPTSCTEQPEEESQDDVGAVAGADAGQDSSPPDEPNGCSTTGTTTPAAALVALLLILWAFLRNRRRVRDREIVH